MAEMFDRQIDRWQMLADRVEAELTEVQKALVQATARQKEMADEAAKLRQMKDQYLHDLAAQQQRDHSVDATTHLRRFLIHLDETLVAVEQQLRQMQAAKQKVEQRYRLLYQEHSKFEALRGRVEQRKDHHERRVEQKQQDLLNVQRFSQN
jgi:flagellar export protein FliJ